MICLIGDFDLWVFVLRLVGIIQFEFLLCCVWVIWTLFTFGGMGFVLGCFAAAWGCLLAFG